MEVRDADIAIYILSAGRADKQHTLNRIPSVYRNITRLVVPKTELTAYEPHAGRVKAVLGCPKSGIGKTRQWILDKTKAKYVLMFDDDLYFFHRIKKGDYHLTTNTMADNKAMIDELFAYLINDGYTHIGLASRTEASFYLCSFRNIVRINGVHGFNVQRLARYSVRFDELPVMEDFNVTLSLLRKGVPNKVLIDYVWNQPGSNSGGGCSTYRTPVVQAKAAHKLKALHSDFVKVVEKKVIGVTSWNGMKTRTDVRIDWHKAWLSSGMGEHAHWKHERDHRRK